MALPGRQSFPARWLAVAALFLSQALFASTFDILVDLDDNSATGCTVATPAGPFPGVEFTITTTVNTGVYPPMVSGVTRQNCIGGAFGPPATISNGGWPVGIGTGTFGFDVLETYFPVGTPYGQYRMGFVYTDPNQNPPASDALVTTNGLRGGPEIIFDLGPFPVIPTLAHGALLLLAFALAWLALRRLREHQVSTLLLVGVMAAMVAGTAWAAIVLDGLIGDWAGVPPLATDATGDAPAGADLAAVYARLENSRVFVRADVKTVTPASFTSASATTFTTGVAGSFAVTTFGVPPVNDITQSGTLPGGVSFVYTAGQGTAGLTGTPNAGTGGSYPLTLNASNGVLPAASQNFTLTVNQAPAITSANNTAFIVGTAGTFTFTSTGFPNATLTLTGCAPALPGGLSFTDNGNGTATLAGSAALGSVGVKNCTLSAANGVGAPVTQSFALTINQAPSTTVATSGANPSVIGQSVTFTATVTAAPPGSGVPSGNVQFMDGANPLGGPVALNGSGVATLGTSALAQGAHPISVNYLGDANFTVSSGSLPTQTVNLVGTGTAVTSTVNPSVFGQSVTFTATVTAIPPGSGTPTGTVQFKDGSSPLGAPIALNGSGIAQVSTSTLGPAAHGISAEYSGDASFAASTGALPTQTVNRAATATGLASSVNPAVFGQSTTFTATVTVTAPGAGTPTGTVQFKDGAGDLGAPQALAAGVATLSTGSLSAGSHAVTAIYSGDADFGTSTGSLPTQAVNKANTTTGLVSNNNPALAGQAITFTATVAPSVPGAGVPTGSVDFLDGITPLGSGTLVAGVAQFTTSALAPGVHASINTTYGGDAGFNGSNGGALSQTVNQAPTAVADSAYTTVHDAPLTITAAGLPPGVLANDTLGFPPAAITNVSGTACPPFPCAHATAQAGSVSVGADGGFAYTPPASFAGDDTFAYTLLNASGNSTATVTISVTDARPVVDLDGDAAGIDFAASFTEAAGAVPIVQTVSPDELTVTDSDSATLASATAVITNLQDGAAESIGVTCPDAGPGCSGAILLADVAYTPATGTLAIARVAPLADYQALLRTLTYNNSSQNPGTTPRDITVTVNDGIFDNAPVAHALVTVTAVNTAPVLANIEPAALGYTVNAAAAPITATLTANDADSATLAGATVQLTTNCTSADDVLSFGSQNGISGVYTAATCTMTLTGTSSVANYQAALRDVKYSNTNDATSTSARVATFRVSAGAGVNNLSNTQTRTINVRTNTPPVLANIEGAALPYTENGAAIAITATLTVADTESPNLAGATVQLTANCASAEDVLSFTTQNGISGAYTAATCLMTLSGSSSVANYQAALRDVRYSNTSDNPSTASRTASFQANDGAPSSNLSNIVTRTITIAATNDPPVLVAGGTLNYTENDPASVIDATVTVNDADSASLASATAQITGNCANPQDVLSFTSQNGISGVYTAAGCLMTLTGSATLANWQAALRSVKYNNTSENPGTLARTVTWIGNDGTAPSAPVTSTINVTAVNDAPVLTAGATLSYTENQAATAIDTTITISDVDSANLAGATAQITGNCANPQDVLSFTTQNGISGVYTAATCLLTLSGSSSVANYQAALRSVKYNNASDNPSTLARTVTWRVDDGGAVNNLSNTATSTINVTAVNDPPTANGFTNLPAQAGIPITYPAGKLGGTDPEGTAITINTTPDSLCSGCLLTINADGSFTFTPPPSAAGTTVSFTYHVTDSGNPPPGVDSAAATVSFNVAGPVIYFVKQSAVGTGNCTLGNECTLATAVGNIGVATNARIFIGDAASHAAAVPLNSGGWLIGQGVSTAFDTLFGIGVPAQGNLAARPATGADRPTVQNTVTVNTNSTVRGLDISTRSATGLSGGAVTGAVINEASVSALLAAAIGLSGTGSTTTLDSATSTGGTNNILLTNVTGTLVINGGALSGASGDALKIDGQNANVTYTGTITNAATLAVNIANKTGGTVALSGDINPGGAAKGISASGNSGGTLNFSGANKKISTGTGNGVNLATNTGATINFTGGGLAIATTSGIGFNAAGGGTVTVQGAANTVASTTGTALNVANTTIGAANLTFQSLSATGGSATGIILDTTGASGGLTVTGDGANTSVGGNSTGGTIANKSGADTSTTTGIGIYLNSTSNVVLRRMTINGTNTNYGIRGNAVNGFTLEYSTVSGTNGTNYNADPNNAGEGSIYFGDTTNNGISSSGTFTNNVISGGEWRNLSITNTANGAGNVTTLTFKGNTFGLNLNNGHGNQSLAVENRGTATINSTVGGTLSGEPNTFTGAPGDLVNFTGQTGSTMDVVMRNNALSNSHPGNTIGGGGLTLASQGVMTFNVDGNTMRDAHGSAVTLLKASAGTSLTGRFTNNTIGVAGVTDSGSKSGNGIYVSAAGAGTMGFTIADNQIHQIHGNAHIWADNTGGSYAANFTITGNLLDTPLAVSPSWFAGILISNGSPSSSDTVNVCAKIGGATAGEKNTLTLAGNLGVIVGASGAAAGHTFNLPTYVGGAVLANVESFLAGNNAGSFTTNAYTDPPVTAAAFTGVGTSCPTP